MEMNVEASALLRERLAERSAPGVGPSPSCLAAIDKLLAMEIKRVTFRDELMQAMRM